MELLVLSDIHGERSVLKRIFEKALDGKINALIVCGDLTQFGALTQVEEILEELTEMCTPVFFVPGNCDPKELATTRSIKGSTNMHGKYREIESIGFLGIGGSPFTPFHTPFEMAENEMKKILDETYRCSKTVKKLILISHTPPINTKVDLTSSGIHAGSRAVREFVEAKKPSLVLCGHIHEARGTDTIDGTMIVNPGPASRSLWATVDVNKEIRVKFNIL